MKTVVLPEAVCQEEPPSPGSAGGHGLCERCGAEQSSSDLSLSSGVLWHSCRGRSGLGAKQVAVLAGSDSPPAPAVAEAAAASCCSALLLLCLLLLELFKVSMGIYCRGDLARRGWDAFGGGCKLINLQKYRLQAKCKSCL